MKITAGYERHDEKQVFFGVQNVFKLYQKWMITFLHNLFLFKRPYHKIMFNQQSFTKLLYRIHLIITLELTHKYAPKNALANKSLNLKVSDF